MVLGQRFDNRARRVCFQGIKPIAQASSKMPDLEKARRHRRKVALDETLEHGQVIQGESLPQTWRTVWARFSPRNNAEIEIAEGSYSGSGHHMAFADGEFLVRFSPFFQLQDWIRYQRQAFRIEAMENVDRSRWLVLTARKSAHSAP